MIVQRKATRTPQGSNSRPRFLKATSILGITAKFKPGTIRTPFANSNSTAEEESMTTTVYVQGSSTLTSENSAIRTFQGVTFPQAERTELRRRINTRKGPQAQTVTAATQNIRRAAPQA